MKLRNKKTGEIIEIDNIRFVFNDGYAPFSSLRILNAYWEDCTPAEPLIKDEKIRKAVRAWAKATNTTSVKYWGGVIESEQNDSYIEFDDSVMDESGDNYAIAELCGEEEE